MSTSARCSRGILSRSAASCTSCTLPSAKSVLAASSNARRICWFRRKPMSVGGGDGPAEVLRRRPQDAAKSVEQLVVGAAKAHSSTALRGGGHQGALHQSGERRGVEPEREGGVRLQLRR